MSFNYVCFVWLADYIHFACVKRVIFFIFLGRLSSWVKIRLHTENQLPMLPGSALKVPVWVVVVGGVVASYPLLSLTPTPVEVELGCDNIMSKLGLSCAKLNSSWG